jgi:aspartyl/asparaginyl-tRNA synthetase
MNEPNPATQTTQPVSLATLLTPSKTVSVDYPEFEGFEVELTYLAREELMKLRNRTLKQKFNKKTRAFEEQMDEDLFLTEYVKAVIKGWKGLKYEYVSQLLLIDTDSIDLQDELRFTPENAELLMKNSADFDTWVTEVVGDLENFTKDK